MFVKRLLIALLISLIGSAAFTFWLSTKLRKPAPAAILHYLSPVQNADAGVVLAKDAVKVIDWPASAPLAGAVTKPEDLANRVLLFPINAGEPITDRQLAAVGAGAGLSPRIPEGMRALSLRSDQVTGVAGFLLPGTHVDVLVTYRVQGSDDLITSTVLQDVPVLTAGQQLQADPTGKPAPTDVVTLLLNPLDAQKATLASAQGNIHFLLRNGNDHAHSDDLPTQMFAVGGTADSQVAQRVARNNASTANRLRDPAGAPSPIKTVAGEAAKKPYQVTTISGNKSTVEVF